MISVFGAKGFIGSAFCRKYKEQVIEIERDSVIPLSNEVLYLISTVDNYNIFNDSKIDIQTNLIHLMSVLDNCKDRDITFTFISSWFVYGNDYLPAFETDVCNPKGFYSITKHAAELMLESYCKTFNIKYKIIRMANVIGKNDSKVSKKKNAFQYLIGELKENRPIALYNDGLFYRDYIHIQDAIEGIKLVVGEGESGEIYNLGSGCPNLFKNIISYAHTKLNSKSEIGTMAPTDFHKLVQVKSIYLDITKIEELGYFPKIDLITAIDDIL